MNDDSLVGQKINGYEVLAEIARGGMATVYRARQPAMDRDVALKVLPREFSRDASFLGRFKQEAEITTRLRHRAIVPVYDHGEWENLPFIVMRYMDGGSVDDLIQNGPMTLDEIQRIARQVASALDYAHQQGVLHRDLKPSNILLDSSQDAYLTDFGIARLVGSNVKLTATGVVGTPAYMSPEQAQGHDLDGRSDLYSLGVVLYEMVTGRRPFDGDTPYSIAVMQVTQPVPAPSRYRPDISPGVERVILKTLAKDPHNRYRKATELAGALDDADLVPAKPMSQPVRTQSARRVPHPTPRRPTPAVAAPAMAYSDLIQVTPRPQSSMWKYMLMSLVVAVVLAVFIMGAYLALPAGEQTLDFAATGVYRLTATAQTLER